MLSVEKLADEAALERLIPEWSALEASTSPRLPFRTPCWNILWWQYFRENSWIVSEALHVYALRDQGGRLVAVAPMMLTRRLRHFPRVMRELQFFGADPNITEIRGPVCRDEDQPRVIEALNREFNSRRAKWDWVQWSGIALVGNARQTLEQSGPVQWDEPLQDFYLTLPASWEEFRAGLSRNIKESLRKCYNSLKRDGHEFTFRVVSEPSKAGAAVECFLALHAERSTRQDTVTHPNVFASPNACAFLLDFCQRMAKTDQLRVFQIEIAGVVVATRIGFLLGDELFLYYSGYLPQWSQYSVMTTVVAEALRWAIEHGVRIVNLSTGSDVSKTRWGPSDVSYAKGLQIGPAWHNRLRFGIYQTLRAQSRSGAWIGKALQIVRRRS